MVRHIYLCENSAEGIFSAIYRAYEEGYPHEHNEVVIDTEGRNMELFCEYHTVVTNFEHAVKVARTIRRKISEEAYDFIHRCCGSYEAQKADAIYRFVAGRTSDGKGGYEPSHSPLYADLICD